MMGDRLIVTGIITFGVLLTPMILTMFDFWAGVRKAKQRGEAITSEGWRRTIAKLARYYNVLLAILVIDSIQMAVCWYMDSYHEHNFPVLPFLTLLGAIGIGAIEVKSIFEKAEEKVKKQTKHAASLIAAVVKSKGNTEELAKAIEEYMKK